LALERDSRKAEQMKGKSQMNEVMRTKIKRCSTCTAEVVLHLCVPCVYNTSRANGNIRSRRQALIAVSLYPLLSILALFTLCSRTEAITYEMRGVIDELSDSVDLFDDSLGIGSSYAASLSISPGVPTSPGFYLGGGFAPENDIPQNDIRYRALLGEVQEFENDSTADAGFLQIENNSSSGDRFLFFGEAGATSISLDFMLADPSGTALDNLALPARLDIADWSTARWIVSLGPEAFARGRITSITVPETSDTLGLLTIGLLALTAIARRIGRPPFPDRASEANWLAPPVIG
jgi:hypothetical protein